MSWRLRNRRRKLRPAVILHSGLPRPVITITLPRMISYVPPMPYRISSHDSIVAPIIISITPPIISYDMQALIPALIIQPEGKTALLPNMRPSPMSHYDMMAIYNMVMSPSPDPQPLLHTLYIQADRLDRYIKNEPIQEERRRLLKFRNITIDTIIQIEHKKKRVKHRIPYEERIRKRPKKLPKSVRRQHRRPAPKLGDHMVMWVAHGAKDWYCLRFEGMVWSRENAPIPGDTINMNDTHINCKCTLEDVGQAGSPAPAPYEPPAAVYP